MSREQERKLFDAVTSIDDDIIEEALDTQVKVHARRWKRWGAVAACAVILIGVGGLLAVRNLLPFGGNAGSGGAGHTEGSSTFMSYAGPIFPLTLSEPDQNVTADRNITYHFALEDEEDLRVWGSDVEDHYTLSNCANEEKSITAIYPFSGNFRELMEEKPTIAVNGQQVATTLYAGGYSGGFTGVYGGNNPNGSENIRQLNSWEGYKSLLEDGTYQAKAYSAYPTLSQQVTVYTFTDFEAPLEKFSAATQAISFSIDSDKTTILQYGFEGAEIGENGFRRYSYSVPDKSSKHSNIKMLIVLGTDIGAYTLQGYTNGGCEKGEELDGVSATVTRSREVLSELIGRLIEDYFIQYGDGTMAPVSREMFLGAVSEFLCQYGLLSESVRDRYQYGMIEDIISETNNLQRVFYLEFPVMIPADKTVSITATMYKKPSFDFGCSGSDNVGVQGYDMVTKLGSNLYFNTLTAELSSRENIQIVRQNYGFDLSKGIVKTKIDPDIEHYYLEIRPLECHNKS